MYNSRLKKEQSIICEHLYICINIHTYTYRTWSYPSLFADGQLGDESYLPPLCCINLGHIGPTPKKWRKPPPDDVSRKIVSGKKIGLIILGFTRKIVLCVCVYIYICMRCIVSNHFGRFTIFFTWEPEISEPLNSFGRTLELVSINLFQVSSVKLWEGNTITIDVSYTWHHLYRFVQAGLLNHQQH